MIVNNHDKGFGRNNRYNSNWEKDVRLKEKNVCPAMYLIEKLFIKTLKWYWMKNVGINILQKC